MASRRVSIKYIGPLVVYKIVNPHNYLLITLDRKLLRGLFEHDRLKPAVIRTNQGNVTNLSKLKQVMYKYLLYIQNSENNLLLTSFHSLTWPLHQVCMGKCLDIQYSEKNYSLQYCFLII